MVDGSYDAFKSDDEIIQELHNVLAFDERVVSMDEDFTTVRFLLERTMAEGQ